MKSKKNCGNNEPFWESSMTGVRDGELLLNFHLGLVIIQKARDSGENLECY